MGFWAAVAPILALFGGAMLVQAISNVIGAATGQNPMAQTASTIAQNFIPLFVTLMPMIILMNFMMSMMNMIMAPVQAMGRMITPTYVAYTY